MTDKLINLFKREDAKFEDAIQYVVPVSHGQGVWGPGVYADNKPIGLWEKQNYANLLTGIPPNVVASITDKDIANLKDKQYKEVERDFNNYVGTLLKPNENPANKEFLHKIYPEWFDKQKKAIENWHDTKKRVESLLITGPKNQEDLFMLYRLGYNPTGPTILGNDGASNVLAPLVDQLNSQGPKLTLGPEDDNLEGFKRGIFNLDRNRMALRDMMGQRSHMFANALTGDQIYTRNQNELHPQGTFHTNRAPAATVAVGNAPRQPTQATFPNQDVNMIPTMM